MQHICNTVVRLCFKRGIQLSTCPKGSWERQPQWQPGQVRIRTLLDNIATDSCQGQLCTMMARSQDKARAWKILSYLHTSVRPGLAVQWCRFHGTKQDPENPFQVWIKVWSLQACILLWQTRGSAAQCNTCEVTGFERPLVWVLQTYSQRKYVNELSAHLYTKKQV